LAAVVAAPARPAAAAAACLSPSGRLLGTI